MKPLTEGPVEDLQVGQTARKEYALSGDPPTTYKIQRVR